MGKTAVAIALAKRLNTFIISADSRQCYREMTIGTAKPSPAELSDVKHYFIDEFPVTELVTAADFEALALKYLEDIFKTSDTAVVCGGTGLYIKALCQGLDEMPAVSEPVVKDIEAEYRQQGLEWLQQAVRNEDPAFFDIAEQQNPARLLRALSFVRSTGKSITLYRTGNVRKRPFQIIKVALELPREVLYSRINERVDKMMAQGLLAEVEQLLPYKHNKNLQTVGYAEIFDYLDGKCSLDESIEKIKQHTRNYAKRQMTWFRKEGCQWLNAADSNIVQEILNLG